jgi:Tfp pilus assembly PilM family ATPase
LRCAQLRRARGRWTLQLAAAWNAPREIEDFRTDEELRRRAAAWLRQLDVAHRETAAGLSPPDVELHAMELPAADGPDSDSIRHAAHWEIERLMTFDEGTAETAHWPLPGRGALRATAIGVAAPRSNVQYVIDLCSAGKLDCVQIDASSCALARFALLIREPSAVQDVWGILDLGARRTRLVLGVDDTPVLVRTFDYGGRSWTHQIAIAMQVKPETAERHKYDFGVCAPVRGGNGGKHALGEMIFNAVRGDIDGIVAEIERSYRYVLSSFPTRPPGPLLLVGGGAAMPHFAELISDRLGISVKAPDYASAGPGLDASSLSGRVREPLACYAGAIGLALGGGEP